jgi:hypothetical protein
MPLDDVIDMMDAAKNRHAVEVSVQRAAKRLEQKCLIQRCYITDATIRDRTRTFISVRITPTTEELASAADLRAEAKQVHSRHTLEAVNWTKKRGQAPLEGGAPGEVVGYHRAALDWFDEEQDRSDGKWSK